MAQYPATIDLGSLNASTGLVITGPSGGDDFGRAVSGAGDFNGDGFLDLMVGAPSASSAASDAGAVYVAFGSASGFSGGVDPAGLDGSNGFRLDGEYGDGAGRILASAGDVNGDGFDDLLVGVHQSDHNGYNSGSAYVVFGSAGGMPAHLDLDSLDGTDGFRLDGDTVNGLAGRSVGAAGDINADGFDDIVVGAPRDGAGEAFVIYGKASGFAATTDLSALGAGDGVRLYTGESNAQLGWAVGGCGDVNGDGFDDILVGAPSAGERRGFVVFGAAGGMPADINLDNLDGSDGFALTDTAYGSLGEALSSAGDINGDGLDDLVISAPFTDVNGPMSGSAFVVFGRTTGFAAELDVAALDGDAGFRIDGPRFSGTGFSVHAAGDVNGDGFDDLIVSAPFIGPSGEGGAYVLFGKASGFDASVDPTALDGTDGFLIRGSASAGAAGYSVDGLGDVNGDGLDDLIVGAPNAGEAYIIYGRLPDAAVNRIGTVASQTLVGGDFNDRLAGVGGDDVLWGHDGTNNLLGGTGDDTLIGGSGSDRMNGGDGADSMTGGRGNDIYFVDNPGDVIVEVGVEGRDTVQTAIDLTLQVGQSIEVLKVWDTTDGLHLVGNEFNTHLVGGVGDDTLQGGGGRDILNGGAGADHFVFAAASDSINLARDRIVDFTQGQDVIDLAGVDADSTQGGDQAFHLAAGNHFHADAGEVIIRHVGANTLVLGDVDGDRSADFALVLSGDVNLTAADFVL